MRKQKPIYLLQPFFILLFISTFSTSPLFSQRCDVNGIGFTQQAGFGNNSRIMIGGFGLNDGSICFNCYSDSNTYGVSRAFNKPVGVLPPVGFPAPNFSARIFQDLIGGVLRIQASPLSYDCYTVVPWSRGISLLPDGSVGIGTDNTYGATLAVNGMIYTRSDIQVNPAYSWPDYVFKKDYILPPLSDLKKRVKELGYIPQIGPGSEIDKNGVKVGDMLARQQLLAEHQLLYQFEMDDKLTAAQVQLDSLHQLIRELAAQNLALQEKITNFDKVFAQYLKLDENNKGIAPVISESEIKNAEPSENDGNSKSPAQSIHPINTKSEKND